MAVARDLTNRARVKADMVSSQFVTDTQLLSFLNEEIAELHHVLVVSKQDYLSDEEIITLVSGQESYPLPDNFLKALKVFPLDSANRRGTPLRRFQLEDAGDSVLGVSASTASPADVLTYRVRGSRIWFSPTPSSGSVELWYVPQFTTLTSLDSPIPSIYPAGWESFAVAGAAAKCIIKAQRDPTSLLSEKGAAKQMVLELLQDRDQGGPAQMIDVTGRLRGRRLVAW